MTARREFRVKWTEDLNAIPQARRMDGSLKRMRTPEEKQVHRMRMLRHMLDAGGWKLSHTDTEGFQVYLQQEAE